MKLEAQHFKIQRTLNWKLDVPQWVETPGLEKRGVQRKLRESQPHASSVLRIGGGGSQLGRSGNPTVPNHLQLPFKYWLSAAHCILLSLLGGGEGALGATGKD